MHVKRAIWFSLLPLLFSPGFIFAYESPGEPLGYVSDFANIIPDEHERAFTSQIAALETSSGNEIAIVTVPSLGGETIEKFAVRLFEEWEIGKAGKDNGVLLLVAPNERDVRIEVGYGLEGDLTDIESGQIIQKRILPAFRAGSYAEGIGNGLGDIVSELSGETPQPLPEERSSSSVFAPFLLFIPIWIMSILARSSSWYAGGILGAIVGVLIGYFTKSILYGGFSVIGFGVVGLLIDYFVSRAYAKSQITGKYPWYIGGRKGFGSGGTHRGGGFGGFGGGRSGGGGASGRW